MSSLSHHSSSSPPLSSSRPLFGVLLVCRVSDIVEATKKGKSGNFSQNLLAVPRSRMETRPTERRGSFFELSGISREKIECRTEVKTFFEAKTAYLVVLRSMHHIASSLLSFSKPSSFLRSCGNFGPFHREEMHA